MLKVFSRLLDDEQVGQSVVKLFNFLPLENKNGFFLQLTDVLIACEGRSVRAHKVVLSACR